MIVGGRREVMRGAAQVVGLGERRTISKSSTRQDVSHIIRNRTERTFQRMLNHNDTIRIERVIEGANWQHSKNGFLKSAPHHTFLVSYESGSTYDSIAQRNTLIHAEMTEIRMTQVTPPKSHTRAKKRQGARLVENDNKISPARARIISQWLDR